MTHNKIQVTLNDDFVDTAPKAWSLTEKLEKQKNLEDTVNRMKRQATDQKKIFVKLISDKGIVFLKLRKNTVQFKNR